MSPTIAKITLSGDRVEEILLVDELYDVAAEALTNMPLPLDFPEQPNITREQVEKDFSGYCQQIMLRTATIEQLAIPDDNISPEYLFIRPVTTKMKFQGYIEHWDRALCFTKGLRANQCPFDYSLEEKKLLFGLAQHLNCMASSQVSQYSAGPTGNANMFNMD